MRELGHIEGRNLAIEWRFADGDLTRLPGLAAELVRMKVDVLVAGGTDAPLALQKATSTIPIVMTSASDPVGRGLVKSLPRPAGNITGLSIVTGYLGAKRLELLRAMVPKVTRVAVLVNPASALSAAGRASVRDGAQQLGVTLLPAEARDAPEIERAFAQMRGQGAGAVIVLINPLYHQHRSRIATLAILHRLPTITADRDFAAAGCLLSYGSSLPDSFRRAAIYVDRILKGAKPGDLPVEEPVKFDLVINRATAKKLGLAIPQALLISAEEVLE
jgi:putative ABC transport system substrate-binding protein